MLLQLLAFKRPLRILFWVHLLVTLVWELLIQVAFEFVDYCAHQNLKLIEKSVLNVYLMFQSIHGFLILTFTEKMSNSLMQLLRFLLNNLV
jgi:hypothetical protein